MALTLLYPCDPTALHQEPRKPIFPLERYNRKHMSSELGLVANLDSRHSLVKKSTNTHDPSGTCCRSKPSPWSPVISPQLQSHAFSLLFPKPEGIQWNLFNRMPKLEQGFRWGQSDVGQLLHRIDAFLLPVRHKLLGVNFLFGLPFRYADLSPFKGCGSFDRCRSSFLSI